jgi:hypothetical protein
MISSSSDIPSGLSTRHPKFMQRKTARLVALVNLLWLFQPMETGRVRWTIPFKKWIEAWGMVPAAITNIHQNDSENEKKIKDLIVIVRDS